MKKLLLSLVLGSCVPVPVMALESPVDCLAYNIYHEARSENLEAQYAVAYVTMNRVKHYRWPDDVCAVVKQPYQFSWYWDGKPDTPYEKHAYQQAHQIARDVYYFPDGEWLGVSKATHYHRNDISPSWSRRLDKIREIGYHTFYE